jgi:hypothetical protein
MTLVWSPGYDDGSTYTPGKLVLKKDSVAVDPNTDPNFANVSLLLYGNGINGSTLITDSSPSPKTVTAVGNAQISTAQSKFGGASIAFDGTGDYIAIAEASGSFTFGTGDFTIEFWFYPSNLIGVTIIAEWRDAGGGSQFITLYRDGSTLYFFESSNRITGTSALTNTVFQHIALCKGSNSTRLFVNGIQVGSTHADTTSYLAPQSGSIYFGGLLGTFSTAGYIDDLRITKGVARYTADFTPPTAAFPNY